VVGPAAILELGLVLLLAALAGAACRRAGLPAVIGYLLIGLAVGPFTPGYVADRAQIQVLADIGVVLLLFEVGIELDLRRLRRESTRLLFAAPLQVVLSTVLGALLLFALGLQPLAATTVALAAALSSSVVVLNITRSRRRTTDDSTNRALVVWAVLQDVVALVAVALLAALLAPASGGPLLAITKLVAFVVIAFLVHTTVVPRLLRALRGEGDTFLMLAVSAALATAGLGSVIFGVPLALAAFVAGLALSSRPEAHEARREVLPFRDLFAAMFFIAIGTLVDPAVLPAHVEWILVVAGLVVLKVALAAGLSLIFGVRARSLQLGVALGQIGEFSFVVLGLGTAAQVLTGGQLGAILAVAVATIAVSAMAARLFPRPLAT
jgi:monovalent cation:H+ antiporter-2, CPA2 family